MHEDLHVGAGTAGACCSAIFGKAACVLPEVLGTHVMLSSSVCLCNFCTGMHKYSIATLMCRPCARYASPCLRYRSRTSSINSDEAGSPANYAPIGNPPFRDWCYLNVFSYMQQGPKMSRVIERLRRFNVMSSVC